MISATFLYMLQKQTSLIQFCVFYISCFYSRYVAGLTVASYTELQMWYNCHVPHATKEFTWHSSNDYQTADLLIHTMTAGSTVAVQNLHNDKNVNILITPWNILKNSLNYKCHTWKTWFIVDNSLCFMKTNSRVVPVYFGGWVFITNSAEVRLLETPINAHY
jgi:hypothetical protein